MKTIVNLLIVFTALSCDNLSHKNFYVIALHNADKQNKFILLDFTAPWCGGCKAYDKYIFQDSTINEKLSKQFIILKINRDKPENFFLNDKYKIVGLPQIVIINSDELMLGSIDRFYSRYVDKPDLFISEVTTILNTQDKIRNLESIFNSDTTNIASINNLLDAYIQVNQYIKIQELQNLLVRLDPTPERLLDFKFKMAINSLQNNLNTEPLMTIIHENPNLNDQYSGEAYSRLLYHYRDVEDLKNQDIYYLKLLKTDPGYFKKEYARFLFENGLKIDTAIQLTNECILNEDFKNDHWGQFLIAHSLAYKGEIEHAVQGFNNWMVKNKNKWESGNSYWALYFYAGFANRHNVDLERALAYIQIAEKNQNMIDEKLLIAEILNKLGRVDESIVKLNESMQLTSSQIEYNRINGLIQKYSKKEIPGS